MSKKGLKRNNNEGTLTPKIDPVGSNNEAMIVHQVSQEYFSGPIPSPEVMTKYEKILPGSAERILQMAENQSSHRMTLESKVIPRQQKESSRGQIFAFVLVFMLICVAVFAILQDCAWIAGIIVSVTIISVATLLISGKQMIKKDISEKS